MSTVIGERINTTLKKVTAAVANQDTNDITAGVKQQEEAGASLPLCLNSPDPAVRVTWKFGSGFRRSGMTTTERASDRGSMCVCLLHLKLIFTEITSAAKG
ncbi:hypothetical protein DSLASN_08650 [Desulfoluna limicola]|uniref:Uncharacterized protein n=1 Tax=Desulfoluna limicola TaxID=2810562 RepID=A0ABM7PDR6_9BACT|nr:hypothetical protein [Desulfoluna limicola]BCS95233.1 hypothetical protein DSLASN_08650 [Desulfoluna limicola]